jgi:hypothetical protein
MEYNLRSYLYLHPIEYYINPITNLNPVYSHSITWQYTHEHLPILFTSIVKMEAECTSEMSGTVHIHTAKSRKRKINFVYFASALLFAVNANGSIYSRYNTGWTGYRDFYTPLSVLLCRCNPCSVIAYTNSLLQGLQQYMYLSNWIHEAGPLLKTPPPPPPHSYSWNSQHFIRRFITMLTRVHHWSPSWASWIQFTTSHTTCRSS